jgi:hypothetical protein
LFAETSAAKTRLETALASAVTAEAEMRACDEAMTAKAAEAALLQQRLQAAAADSDAAAASARRREQEANARASAAVTEANRLTAVNNAAVADLIGTCSVYVFCAKQCA